jgi:hypothetical protein
LFRVRLNLLMGIASIIPTARQFAGCSVLPHGKTSGVYRKLLSTAEDAISKGLNPPDYTHFSIRFSALDNKLMPINRAIHLAVERYGLRVQMAEATVVGRDSQHGGIHGSQAAVSFGKAA